MLLTPLRHFVLDAFCLFTASAVQSTNRATKQQHAGSYSDDFRCASCHLYCIHLYSAFELCLACSCEYWSSLKVHEILVKFVAKQIHFFIISGVVELYTIFFQSFSCSKYLLSICFKHKYYSLFVKQYNCPIKYARTEYTAVEWCFEHRELLPPPPQVVECQTLS